MRGPISAWPCRCYTFATPVFGGQATVGLPSELMAASSTSLAGTLTGTLATPLGTIPFSRSDSISDAVWGFGDLIPIATLRWNAGVHNYMTYITGDVPVGAYDSTRLSNLGIGHGAIDAGGGYTYFNPATGHEFSGVLGFTYNFENQSTQYQNGVDMHFDWSRLAVPDQAISGRTCGLRLQGDRLRQRLRRPGRLLPIAGGRRRAAARLHYSRWATTSGLPQYQRLQGICRGEPSRWLEYLGHIHDFAGCAHAERTAAKGDAHEIARPISGSRLPEAVLQGVDRSGSGQKTVVPST